MIDAIRQRSFAAVASIGFTPDDDEERRLKKAILIVTTILISIAGVIWGILYMAAQEYVAAVIPLAYSVISAANLWVLGRTHNFRPFRTVQITITLLLPFTLMLMLGGFINGSAVILWGLLAPFGALLCWNSQRAIQWYLVYLASVITAGLLTPILPTEINLSDGLITTFYVINVGAVSGIAFTILLYFVKQKELALQLMQRNRELERANMEQELLLRQSEKLATLGRLSAGIAHELNNPAAAAQRGAVQLKNAVAQLEQAKFQLGQMVLSDEHCEVITKLDILTRESNGQSPVLDPLERSDREYRIETHLADKGIENAWEYAPVLVNMNYDVEDVTDLARIFTPEQFVAVITALSSAHATHSLLAEIGQGAGRITEIVRALKTYTYLDQAPVQFLDVHEGLENTLVMLRSKLRDGIEVRRDYTENLPCIHGYGSELNQVWTNIIDNAIDAMDGSGILELRTRQDGSWVVVEIADNGPGIPPEIQSQIFDPFYTTKPLGKGTGLGLNISQNIIVQKHKGKISVHSQPGETRFVVKLPLYLETPVAEMPAVEEGLLEESL